MDLIQRLGWNTFRQQELAKLNQPSWLPARVAVEHRGGYGLLGCDIHAAKLSGRLRHMVEAGAQRPVAPGVRIIATSSALGSGSNELRACISPGVTAAMIGSSGVGKSSLLNTLLGQNRQATRPIRVVDEKGRHATTRRELVEVGDGCLIDTPGMREVGLWDAEVGRERAFEDVEVLARSCRFRDCRHAGEPGCAVQIAAEAGALDDDRLANYERLRREQAHMDAQHDMHVRAQTKQRWKTIHKQQRARSKVDPKLRED